MGDTAAGDTSAVPLAVRPLDTDTWPAFARLVEANNGVWGGCWCMGFHVRLGKGRTPQQNRAEKEQRVQEGRTRAALVFAGDDCVGWCQFGTPAELPEVKSRRRYEKELTVLPDWRVTCFFTGKGLRGRGVAHAALGGALAEIARLGGGTVEGYPEETDDRPCRGRFCTPGRWPFSRTTGSFEPARSRPIAGWSR
ncbi:GNAT family N-acetyltransferase [Streptomyces sp. NPDC088387]|uniref:GNAT family N-acetyltransferase n=1 Tax=Streptomyces sp. NPDC088387 TaxID=3365859 RepID=UPI0037F196C0